MNSTVRSDAADARAQAAEPALAPAPVPVLEVCGASRVFTRRSDLLERGLERLRLRRPPGAVHAVDRVDLQVGKGEVVGVVGESGCGKSTLGRMAVGLLEPTAGSIRWNGSEAQSLRGGDYKRAKLKIQMIFQNPYASLNPRMRARDIVADAARIHGLIPGSEDAFVDAQFRRVGLDPNLKERWPHQFSGGQRQRLGIARALSVAPDLLVCDEAVAALDVSIQAQILNLFLDLREQLGLSYLFISHDLGVVRHLSDRVVIMYLGRVVEQAPVAEVFARPNHPYTRVLLEEMPRIDPRNRQFATISGEIPSPLNPPSGCAFHPRCPKAMPRCREAQPVLRQVAPGHLSACHLNDVS